MFKTFESLNKSNIEGIEILARQFNTIAMNMKSKQYDMLAPRSAEFGADFVKFTEQIRYIEVCIFVHSLCLKHVAAVFLSIV